MDGFEDPDGTTTTQEKTRELTGDYIAEIPLIHSYRFHDKELDTMNSDGFDLKPKLDVDIEPDPTKLKLKLTKNINFV